MFNLVASAEAPLKIVIAGNHDITLDVPYYESVGKARFHGTMEQDTDAIRELWTGADAQKAGIVYLEEEIRTFTLQNGATFTIFASPYQPEFCDWAFGYPREEDRFSPASNSTDPQPKNPIPPFPAIDIMLTHGPPLGVLDEVSRGEKVGCEHLMRAVRRCRPRLHCFGHIHEGWGAQKIEWTTRSSEPIPTDPDELLKNGCAIVDLSKDSTKPLVFGEETVFVNAAIMNAIFKPWNAPWRIDMDLPLANQS
ncbi:MAG: hypothetical protein Q9174_007126 [Haloplaca sp. 1 TL-2023]